MLKKILYLCLLNLFIIIVIIILNMDENDEIIIKKININSIPLVDGSIDIAEFDPNYNTDVFEMIFDMGVEENENNENNVNTINMNLPLKQNINLISKKKKLRNEIQCPITYENTKDVRVLNCGHKFNCIAIETHFKTNRSCPMCRCCWV